MSPATTLIFLGIIALVVFIITYSRVVPETVKTVVQWIGVIVAVVVVILFVRALV
jgi:multisubunit Na+/H+ antiporter MnhG subunit